MPANKVRRSKAARRHHEHDARAGALEVEIARHPADIARENRRKISVDHGRVAARNELDERRGDMAFGDLGKAKLARDRRDQALVRRIAIGVHEHDRDGVITLSARFCQRGAHALRVGRGFDRAVRTHALVDLDDAGIKLLGLDDVAREDARARLIADLERIAKAARGDEQRALAPPLEQRIGGDRCPHLDGANDAGRNRVSGRQGPKADGSPRRPRPCKPGSRTEVSSDAAARAGRGRSHR